MMLQACLGLRIHGDMAEVESHNPILPHGIDRLAVQRLSVAGDTIDLVFERLGSRVAVHSNSRGPRLKVSYG